MENFVHFQRSGVSLLIRLDHTAGPVVEHWGGDLGALSDAELEQQWAAGVMSIGTKPGQTAQRVSLVASASAPWLGRPSLLMSRPDGDAYTFTTN